MLRECGTQKVLDSVQNAANSSHKMVEAAAEVVMVDSTAAATMEAGTGMAMVATAGDAVMEAKREGGRLARELEGGDHGASVGADCGGAASVGGVGGVHGFDATARATDYEPACPHRAAAATTASRRSSQSSHAQGVKPCYFDGGW